MKMTTYVVPAKGCQPLDVPATIMCRLAKVDEDAGSRQQGLWCEFLMSGGAPGVWELVYTLRKFGDGERVLGRPQQKSRDGVLLSPADTLFRVTSATETPATIVVTEWE